MSVIIRVHCAPTLYLTDCPVMIQKLRMTCVITEKAPDLSNSHITRTARPTLCAFAIDVNRLMVFGASENRPRIQFFLSTITKWSPASRKNGLSRNM